MVSRFIETYLSNKRNSTERSFSMKRASTVVVMVGVLLVGIIGVPKVRTYLSLGRESLVATIDRSLGTFRVKTADVNHRIRDLEESARTLQEGQLKCEVQADQLAKKMDAVKDKQGKVASSLQTLRTLIAKGEEATLAGRPYSISELHALAEDAMRMHETLQVQSAGLAKAKELLETNAMQLRTKVRQARGAVAGMRVQMEEVEAKITSLETLRQAAQTAGGYEETLATTIEGIQRELDDLYASVETRLRMEESDWHESSLTADPVYTSIEAGHEAETTLERIDEIVGQ
jgi:chromosome segregation ATPase